MIKYRVSIEKITIIRFGAAVGFQPPPFACSGTKTGIPTGRLFLGDLSRPVLPWDSCPPVSFLCPCVEVSRPAADSILFYFRKDSLRFPFP